MTDERSIELAKAVQILRGSGREPEQLIADLTDALANALTERDELQKQVTAQASAIEDLLAGRALDDAQFAKDKAERDALQNLLDAALEEIKLEAKAARCEELERILNRVSERSDLYREHRDVLKKRLDAVIEEAEAADAQATHLVPATVLRLARGEES